jgi:hypothetical protein
MMRKRECRPSWRLLYLLWLGTIGLLALGALAHLSERGHEVAAVGALLLVYGLVELWLRANTPALLHVDKLFLAQQARTKVVRQTTDEEDTPVLVSWPLRPASVARPMAGGEPAPPQQQAGERLGARPVQIDAPAGLPLAPLDLALAVQALDSPIDNPPQSRAEK